MPNDFRNKGVSKKKRLFDYESSDVPIESPKSRYGTEFFNIMIDSIVNNMDSRFLSLNEHFQNFGFLYDLKKLKKNSKRAYIKKRSRFAHSPASG